ncbi:MAG: NAD(P)-dependent oxidoreductase [Legionellales bacterium]|nr:NAD(P)-dependent oxidoreductase [Legionellales bacterium]|tara:strand:- start:804 stop:1661 length:858 start_codon:yes stop_codon:yes gene_type:complete
MKIGLLGYGYTANFFAQRLVALGHDVWGTSRNPSIIKQPNITIINFDLTEIIAALQQTTHLLISIPPNNTGKDPCLDLLDEVLISHKNQFQWIAYLSSTGVYGDHHGQWVDENSSCNANSFRNKYRRQVEQAWLANYHLHHLPIIIFRLAGIYGPNRNSIARLHKGKRTSVYKKDLFFSRIHVLDICEALLQSIYKPMLGEVFNLADDMPCNPYDVDCYAAKLLEISAPQAIDANDASLSTMAKSFYISNKKVSNTKMKKFLLPKLLYSNYKIGLRALLNTETNL